MGWITVLHMPFTFNRQTQDFLCGNFRAAREWKLQGLSCSQLATSTVSLPLHATGQIKSQAQPRFTGAKTKNQPPSGTVSVTLQRGMQSQGRISVHLFYFFPNIQPHHSGGDTKNICSYVFRREDWAGE